MRTFRVFCILFVIAILASASFPAVAQQEEARTALLRIGYFAFDPEQYDTFIDGELVHLGDGWGHGYWMYRFPGGEVLTRGLAATYFFVFPSGAHRFAFAPQGKGIEAVILGPKEVTVEAGHSYSLVVFGSVDDKSLDMLTIDETQAFAEVDHRTHYMGIYVNLLSGAPAIEATYDDKTFGPVAYGKYWTVSGTSFQHIEVRTSGSSPETLMSIHPGQMPASLSDLAAMVGAYPGTYGYARDYIHVWNLGYPGPVAIVDGGAVKVGDTLAGKVSGIGQRIRYTLKLDASAKLNIYARSAGQRIMGGAGAFDPVLYVYDARGIPLFWNDELTITDDVAGVFDAGLEGITLQAGTYTIHVSGAFDTITGPFKLSIEAAKSS